MDVSDGHGVTDVSDGRGVMDVSNGLWVLDDVSDSPWNVGQRVR